jgi:hypothetical protein
MMIAIMSGKGKKTGEPLEDKLSEALRRAEEAVLRDGKLRDEQEKVKKPSGRKPLDMEDVVPQKTPKKPPAPRPVDTSKPPPGPRMVFLDKEKAPRAKKPGEAKPAIQKAPAASARPSPDLGFGELDLGGPGDMPELELAPGKSSAQPTAQKPSQEPPRPAAPAPVSPAPVSPAPVAPAPVAPAPVAPAPVAPPAEQPEPFEFKRPPRRSSAEETAFIPRRSYAREIKIALIVLLVLAAVGAGVFGIIKWRESVAAEKAALKEQINSASRESLMNDTIKKEKFK